MRNIILRLQTEYLHIMLYSFLQIRSKYILEMMDYIVSFLLLHFQSLHNTHKLLKICSYFSKKEQNAFLKFSKSTPCNYFQQFKPVIKKTIY